MKTLFGLVRGLKRIRKKDLRQPKKIWRVDIEINDLIWTALVSEHPCMKHLHELWQRESVISGSWIAAHCGPASDPIEVAAWKRQNEVAKKLIDIFFAYRNGRAGLHMPGSVWLGETSIGLTEEVLN